MRLLPFVVAVGFGCILFAQEVVAETTRWGLKNAHLEPWEFGQPRSDGAALHEGTDAGAR